MNTVTASIAHEVNQPLAAIVANGNAALRWLQKTPPEATEARENVKQIINDGYRATQVVSGIRAMFKRDEHSKAVLDVNEVVQEVVELLRAELSSRRVSVRTELGQELPQISADRVQLQQVLHNLVMNAGEAMSAMPDDARVLTISSKHHARNEVIIVLKIPVRASIQKTWNAFSTRSLLRSRKAWAWGCPYVARSSNPTAVGCGRRHAILMDRFFVSRCRALLNDQWF